MQLVAVGLNNQHLKNIYSNEYITIDFNNNTLDIPRNADLNIPLYLSFEMKNNITLEEFNDLLIDAKVNLIVGNRKLYTIDLVFLSKLNPIKKVNNKFLVTLPFNFLLGHLNLVGLQFQQVTINVTINMENIEKISGIFEYIYMDSNERKDYASKYIYQKNLALRKINDVEVNYVNGNFNYKLDLKTNYGLGIFICLENQTENIEIKIDDKIYNFKDCEIINNNLVYFSFNNLGYKDKKNFIVETGKINEIIISLNNSNAKFYILKTSYINYNSGMLFPFHDIYGPNILNVKDENMKYNMHIEMMNKQIEINEINGMKVCNFIGKKVTNQLIGSSYYYKNFKIYRFCNCTMETNIQIPDFIEIIIMENTYSDLINLPYSIKEIWLINSIEQTNIPITLNKLRLFGKYDLDKMKIPFGCEVEYEE